MIKVPCKSPQTYGTDMISASGQKTVCLYLAFNQEDPIVHD